MKIVTPLFLTLLTLSLWSCEKSSQEFEPINAPIATKMLTKVTADEPTSISKGMKNYESFFLSSKDNKIHGYLISTPLNYDHNADSKYPLLVFMHGDGEKPGTLDYDLNKLKLHGPHKEIFNKGRAFPAIIVSIQMAKSESVVNPAVVKELIDILTGEIEIPNPNNGAVGLGRYNIDMNKIHLTGLSQGGNGAFKTAYTYPSFFASISTFAGYTGPQASMSLIKIPTYIRHNSGDNTVDVAHAYNAQSWINAANPVTPVNFLIFNVNGHDAWTNEYANTASGNVYDWHWAIAKNGIAPAPIPPIVNDSTALKITTYSPAINSSNATKGYSTLTLLFNKNIVKRAGLIEVKNLTDNTSFKAYASWGMVSANTNKLSIYPVQLENNKKYAVRIEKGAVADEEGNLFNGINDDNTWTFTTGVVTEIPTSPNDEENNKTIALSSTTPANNAVITKPANGYLNLSLIFNKPVNKGAGLIEVKNITDGTSFITYASWGMVATDNNSVNIYPVPVAAGKTYAITIANNAFKDYNNTFFSGINNNNTWTFSVK